MMLIQNFGFQSEAAVDLSNIIKRFEVTQAYEGPQILLKWQFYNGGLISELRIMKKEGAYPLSINDGILVVFGNSSGTYGDLDVSGGTIYYYTLFVRLPGGSNFVFDKISMGKALAITTGYYQDVLWKLIPQVYRIRDELQVVLNEYYIQ